MSLGRRFPILVLLLGTALLCPFVYGQTTGRIAGIVQDKAEKAVARAQVTCVSTTTGEERTVSTDASGNYAISLLPPSLYKIRVTANGLQRQYAEAEVDVALTTTLDITLSPPGVESIMVRASPLLQTGGPELGRVVSSPAISELPLATRNITQILSLSPGVATYLPDNTGLGRNTQTISVNGARMTQNNYQVNGIDANTMGTSSAVNVAIPAPDSVEEFKMQTSLYDATFGRAGGANIQVVTKNGTNSFHGEAYEYFRNDALNANNPFLVAAGAARPSFKRNVFGGTFGGPIVKERAFFFISYQGTRERNGASLINSLSSDVLVAKGLTNDRSEATLLSTFGVPAIDPAALALLNAKLPNGKFAIPTPQPDGLYSGSAVSGFQEDQFNVDVDVRLTDHNTLSAKTFFADAPSTPALPSFRGTGANVPGFGFDQQNNVRVIALRDVHVFTTNVLNEVRLGYNRHFNNFVPEEPLHDADLDIFRANSAELPGLPLIRIAPAAGGVIIGTSPDIAPATPSVFTFADTLSLQLGRHTLRTGAEIRRNQVIFTAERFTRGQIDFNNFDEFLVGTSSLFSTIGNGIGNRDQRAWDYNFFVQDDWKLSSRWTLNLGLRYELDLPPYEASGRTADFDSALYQPPDPGTPTGPPSAGFIQGENVAPQFALPGLPTVSKYLLHSIDRNDFAPRIGFAYSPLASGTLAVRGGYGIYPSQATFAYLSAAVTLPPMYVLGRRSKPSLDDPFLPLPPANQFPTFVPGVPLAGTVFDRNLRTPYFQQYNFSVQDEPLHDFVFEIAYAGTRGLNLFRQVAINQAKLIPAENTPANAAQRAPLQGVAINSFFQNQTTAQSVYHSLQVSGTRRVSHGLMLLASYTFAKSLDNGSGTGGGAGINGIVNPGAVADFSTILGNQLDSRANRGVSDFDRKHRFVLSSLWDLPSLGGAHGSVVHQLLSNWRVGGIITAMSGLPIDIVDTGAGSFYGLNAGTTPLARPSLAPGLTCGSARDGAPAGYFFNPFAFVRPVVQSGQPIPSSGGTDLAGAIGTDIGNVGRNCLRGPRQVNVDFSIARSLRVTESKQMEFRVEFFNVFNHVNFANPISDLNAVISAGGKLDPNGQIVTPGSFGRIISTSSNPRLVQLVAEFRF
jgi:carboxypeptidase family protein/TonB-dependent receptor-like protein